MAHTYTDNAVRASFAHSGKFSTCLFISCKLRIGLVLVSCVSSLWGATLAGTVQDAQQRGIPEAELRLYQRDGGLVTSLTADRAGNYQITHLTAGHYLLAASKAPFRAETVTVDLDETSAKRVNVPLALAGVSQLVVVTAENDAQTGNEVSKALSVIDKAEIESRNTISVADLLRTAPGIQVINSGGAGQLSTLRIRGLRPDAAAVLMDGQRFRDATTTQADASSFLSSLNVVNPERLEVLRGSGSSLYGTNAVGGAVNIVTEPGGGATHGELQVEGGSLGLFRGRTTVTGSALENRFRYSAGLLHLNVTSGVDGQDAARSTGVQGDAAFALTPKMETTARVWGSDDFAQLNSSPTTAGIPEANIPGSGIVAAVPFVTYIPDQNDPDYRRSSRFVAASFGFRQAIYGTWHWQARYQRLHTNREYANGPLGTGFQPDSVDFSQYRGDVDTFSAQIQGQATPWLTLTAGYEFERELYYDHQDDHAAEPLRVFETTNARQRANTAFFNSQFAFLNSRLQIAVSGRAQYFALSQPDFTYSGAADNYLNAKLPSPPAAYTGDASIAYLLPRLHTKLRSHAGNAYRSPSLYERFGAGFYDDFITGKPVFSPYGDPRLSPDRYNSFDAGVDQYLFNDRLQASATAFYTRIVHVSEFDFNGLIQPATDPYGRSSGYYNGSGGISRGAEFSLRFRPARSISAYGSYTYVNLNNDRDTAVPGYFGAIGVAKHTTAFVVTDHWTRHIDTTVDFYHYSSINAPLYAGFAPRVYQFPGFSRTGLVGSYQFWNTESKSARTYVRLDNSFNRTYYEAGFLASGITAVGGLAFSF